ncbi:MAG: hypothetical protein R2751_10090 [Bacteroidales bacterium]
MSWNDRLSEKFSYNLNANFSTLKNEGARRISGQQYIDGGSAGSPADHGRLSHLQLLPRTAGDRRVYPIRPKSMPIPTALARNVPENRRSPVEPGDFAVDQNGDGVIDGDDRVVLGSYLPTYMFGFNASIQYGNFEFSVNMVGQGGNKILNRKRGQLIWTNDGNLDADLAQNRWHGEGTSDIYPSSGGLRKAWNQKMSTYFVEDGDFFRIQNVRLAYNLDDVTLAGRNLPDMSVFVTADRPVTLFTYNGFSPEVPSGIDTQTYPIPAVYTLGLNLRF